MEKNIDTHTVSMAPENPHEADVRNVPRSLPSPASPHFAHSQNTMVKYGTGTSTSQTARRDGGSSAKAEMQTAEHQQQDSPTDEDATQNMEQDTQPDAMDAFPEHMRAGCYDLMDLN